MDVLIVEDDRVLALMLRKMVQRMNYDVTGSVTTGEEAVEIAEKDNPDLILMDIMLEGDIDGIEAMKQIKQNISIPVIYITGNSDQTTIDRAKETNYMAYMVKPIAFEELKTQIKKLEKYH